MSTHRWGVSFELRDPFPSMPVLKTLFETRIERETYDWGRRAGRKAALFQYTLSGDYRYADERGESALPPGTAFLVPYDDRRYRYWLPKGWPGMTVLWCHLDGQAAHAHAVEMKRRHGGVYRLERSAPILRKLLSFDRGEVRTLRMGVAENYRLASELFAALLETKERQKTVDASERLIERALQVLGDEPAKLYKAGELARKIEVSREHLCRVFRQRLRASPYEFIVRQKIDLARIDLRHGNDRIQEISRRYGFTSPVQFTTLFRRITGLAPRDDRGIRGGAPES
ncbi:MAG: helix-turn-helix transcriptional regulator [Spirochaetes bacterium]|nr:helix-turn-helix transcriptional regulator [Spirochaetota bacterium]